MNSESARFAPLDRLHDEGVLPEMCDAEIGPTRTTREQRARGAWAWQVTWNAPGQAATRRAGSAATMDECLEAGAWRFTRLLSGDTAIVPSTEPTRRST